MKAHRIIAVISTAAMLLTGKAMAGGGYGVIWDNVGWVYGTPCPFYSDGAGTQPLSAGSLNVAGDGDLVQLIAYQGGTNFVLGTTTIGDNVPSLSLFGSLSNGFFLSDSYDLTSNQLAAAFGSPLGIEFFDGTTTTAVHATVYNPTVTVPSPNWQFPPMTIVYVEPDATDTNWMVIAGPGAVAGATAGDTGFYVTPIAEPVPEPSTIALACLGLLGAIGLIRRRSSS